MTDKAKAARAAAQREYQRTYRERHPDKIREVQRRYRQNHKEQLNEYQRNYRAAHRDKAKGWRDSYWERVAERTAAQEETHE